MKIVLVNSVGRDRAGNYIIHSPSRWTEATRARENWFVYYPWQLACLSSLLKKQTTHEVKLIDGCMLGLDCSALAVRISREQPGIVIFESGTRVFEDNLAAALEVKKNTGAAVVFVGQHASAFPDSVIRAGVDAVFIGEYEEKVLSVLSSLGEGEKPSGIYDRPENPVDFAAMPWPEDDDVSRIDYAVPGEPSSEFKEIQMYATRGCPRMCKFCVAANIYYARPCHRFRSSLDVVAEIKHLKEKYPSMQGVFFDEESHNANRTFTLELCREIERAGLNNLKYEAMCDFMFLDREVMEAMKRAGYYKVRFGIETTNEKVGRRLGKYIPEEKLVSGLEIAADVGLKTYGTFMLGLPGASAGHDRATIDFMGRMLESGLLHNAQISIAVPQPGTPFYRECIDSGLVDENDFHCLDGSHAVVQSPGYPAEEVARMLDLALSVRNRALLIRNLKSPSVLVENICLKLRKYGFGYTLKKIVGRIVFELKSIFIKNEYAG